MANRNDNVRTILDQHNALADAVRRQGEAMDNAIDALHEAIAAMRAGHAAQQEVIAAMIAANRAALAEWNGDAQNG